MCTARGLAPLPPSISHGVRSPLVLHSPGLEHTADSERIAVRLGRYFSAAQPEDSNAAEQSEGQVKTEGMSDGTRNSSGGGPE